MMANIFEQIHQLFADTEWASILVIVLVLSLIVMNITICVCVISMRKSLKEMSRKDCCKKGCCCEKAEKPTEKK